jgi:hypothetical protein
MARLPAEEPGAVGPPGPGKVVAGAVRVAGLPRLLDADAAGIADADPPGGAAAALQVSVYVAGGEATVTGLVTTKTASPAPDAAGGAMVSGGTAKVPAWPKVRVAGAEVWPSDRAQ